MTTMTSGAQGEGVDPVCRLRQHGPCGADRPQEEHLHGGRAYPGVALRALQHRAGTPRNLFGTPARTVSPGIRPCFFVFFFIGSTRNFLVCR